MLQAALDAVIASGELTLSAAPALLVERARRDGHGDYASPLALTLAKLAGRQPRALAEALVARMPPSALVREVEVAGPGFINFHLAEQAFHALVAHVLIEDGNYGHSDKNKGVRVQVEFVSANPTGPLHVGHGRGAAHGAAVANLLAATGCEVQREYYVNDAGRQMAILGLSVWLRYLELLGEAVPFPVNGYRGDYVRDMAAGLRESHGDAFRTDER